MRAISDPNELKILTSLKQKRGYNPQNKDKIVKLQLCGYKQGLRMNLFVN